MQAFFFIHLAAVCLTDIPALLKAKSKPDLIFFITVAIILIVLGILFLSTVYKLSISQFLMKLIIGGK